MTWILENEDGNTRTFDTRDEAIETKDELEDIGAVLELREETDDEPDDELEADVIDMSDSYGGNSNSDSDDDDLEIVGDGGRPYVLCKTCYSLSSQEHRCAGCGADLAGEPIYDGVLP